MNSFYTLGLRIIFLPNLIAFCLTLMEIYLPPPELFNIAILEVHRKLLAVKLLHTLVWSFFVFIIFYILYSGLTNQITTYTWIFIGLVAGEGLVLLTFKMFCPLTLIARKYSDSQKENFDIFLPNWLAKYNKIIFTSIYIVGVILVLIRTFQN